jgi:putative cell wall-binding protein/prenyltransferase beta subunit
MDLMKGFSRKLCSYLLITAMLFLTVGIQSLLPQPVLADSGSIPKRLAGADRFQTANEVAAEGWKAGADNVVLVNGYTFADALAAVPLAFKLNAPILLTETNTIPASTREQIQELGPENITLIGGSGVISQTVQEELEKVYGTDNVLRCGGADRYDTAALIAAALGTTGKAVLANGEDGHYPDALAISSYAAYQGIPILFTERIALPGPTAQALAAQKVSSTIVAGGSFVVPEEIYNQLPGAVRYGGNDRYATAAAIAEGLKLNLSRLYVATGLDFADALTAGNLAAHTFSPIIMVDKGIPEASANFLAGHKEAIPGLVIVGGEGVISAEQESALRQASSLPEDTQVQPQVVTRGQVDETINDLVTWEKAYLQEAFTDAGPGEIVDPAAHNWPTIGLARLERNDDLSTYLTEDEKYIAQEWDSASRAVTNLERMVLAVGAAQGNPCSFGGKDLTAEIYNYPEIEAQGINGPVFALIALDSGDYEIPQTAKWTREKLRKIIMDKQLSDGGFSLDGSGGSDPDITAMVIQALAPYYTDSHPDVRAVVDKAVARLAALQNAAGGFKSWGSINSESVCQTIIALCAIGIDIDTDSRFIKNGNSLLSNLLQFKAADGGFKHILDGNSNAIASEQALTALTAYVRFKDKKSALYDFK